MGTIGLATSTHLAGCVVIGIVLAGCSILPRPASPQAQAACAEVAAEYSGQRATVVGAFDSTVGALYPVRLRAAARNGEPTPGVAQDHPPGDPAYLCYVDAAFEQDGPQAINRIVVIYVPDGPDAHDWGVIDAGRTEDIPVLAP